MLTRIRARLTYANVTASLALFIALGGASYAAVQLPRNSVGSAQIRTGAVSSTEVKDRSLRLRDISPTTRTQLSGKQGPQGPAGPAGATGAPATRFTAAVRASGGFDRGTATSGGRTGIGTYEVGFAQDVSACVATATLGSADGSDVPAGRIVVRGGTPSLGVKTFDVAGAPADLPFHVLVVC